MLASDFKIESNRLIIRSYQDDDLNGHVAILENWDVTKWLSTNIPFPYSRNEGVKFIENAKKSFTNEQEVYFSIIEKTSGLHMGGIKLFSLDKPECEIGYWLGPEFWNKGYASELLGVLIDWLKSKTSVTTLIAQTAESNHGSRKLLEKFGFIHKGTPPKEYSRCGHGSACSEFYRLDFEGNLK